MSAAPSLRFLSQADTQRLLAWPEVIECLAAAYARADDPGASPPRVVARRDGMWLRTLAAISGTGECMGTKIIAKGRTRGADHFIALWDTTTSRLSCLMDGKAVTAMRTAGTSAVAVDRLAPRKELNVAVLGSGREAAAHASAIATVRRFAALRVYSPTPSNRERFSHRVAAELKVDCRAADSPQAAVAGADLVIAAARSHDESPILEGACLRPGMMVVSIGSTVPEQREVDPEVVRRADLIVADVPLEVSGETGDMIAAREAGVAFEHKLVALSDVVRGACVTRQRPDNIVMFKSIGSGLQDIAVSEMCYAKAIAANAGTVLTL